MFKNLIKRLSRKETIIHGEVSINGIECCGKKLKFKDTVASLSPTLNYRPQIATCKKCEILYVKKSDNEAIYRGISTDDGLTLQCTNCESGIMAIDIRRSVYYSAGLVGNEEIPYCPNCETKPKLENLNKEPAKIYGFPSIVGFEGILIPADEMDKKLLCGENENREKYLAWFNA